LAPGDSAEAATLLAELDSLGAGMLPTRLVDRLRSARAGSTDGPDRGPARAARSDAHELARRSVREMPTTPDAFDVAGPVAAEKALRRLRGLPDPPDPDLLAILTRAAAWSDDEPPPFLAELAAARDALTAWLDELPGDNGDTEAPDGSEGPDPALRDLLAEVVAAFEDRVAESPDDGVAAVLQDYREALDGDPDAVQWTLRQYTASYAATCQQAGSAAMRDAKQRSRTEDVSFDTVIVDEAARANPLDLMIPLIHAERRIVLVGDHNQLPQMLEPDVERDFDTDLRQRLSESLFQRLYTSLGVPGAPVRRVVRLNTQFRMHPILGDLVKRHFYEGDLESGRAAEEFGHRLPGYGSAVAAWLDVPASRGPGVRGPEQAPARGGQGARGRARPAPRRGTRPDLRRHHVLQRPANGDLGRAARPEVGRTHRSRRIPTGREAAVQRRG
jgi:hypothetical protein